MPGYVCKWHTRGWCFSEHTQMRDFGHVCIYCCAYTCCSVCSYSGRHVCLLHTRSFHSHVCTFQPVCMCERCLRAMLSKYPCGQDRLQARQGLVDISCLSCSLLQDSPLHCAAQHCYQAGCHQPVPASSQTHGSRGLE